MYRCWFVHLEKHTIIVVVVAVVVVVLLLLIFACCVQFTFASNTATILGGTLVGDRVQLRAFSIFIYSFFMTVSALPHPSLSQSSPTPPPPTSLSTGLYPPKSCSVLLVGHLLLS